MWFKQLGIYIIDQDKLPSTDVISDKLSAAAFTPCTGAEWESSGFVPPASFLHDPVFPAQNTLRVVLRREEKVLPAAVIRELLEERVEEIRQNEGRNVGRKEKGDMKENITNELLPRAFTRSHFIEGLIDTRHNLLMINQANENKAGLLLGKMRDALDGLEAALPRTEQSPGSLMTAWLLDGAAAGQFELDSDCELKGLGDNAPVIRISNQDLTAEEVLNHVKNGKIVTKLGLVWQDRVSFVLTQEMTLTRIRFLDLVQEEAASHGEDPESMLFASQILMSETLGMLVTELIAHLGGLSR